MNIAELTPAQLAELKAQFNAQRKSLADGRAERYAHIDRMLKEKDGEAFRHTTADILAVLQGDAACKVPTVLNDADRAEWLKRIQTRKQHLEKLRDETGALVHVAGSLGYKPSAGGFALTPDRVVDWLMTEGNAAKLTPADVKAILKALKN